MTRLVPLAKAASNPEAVSRIRAQMQAKRDRKPKKTPKPYYNPSAKQKAASQARRVAQADAKANRQNIRIGQLPRESFKRRTLKPLLQPKGLVGLGMAGGAGYALSKADDKHGAALGAVAGAGAAGAVSDIGGQTLKVRLKDRRLRRGESPREAKIWADHKAKHGVRGHIHPGIDAKTKKKIFANYPKSLPDARAQRLLARKNPKLIVATGALAGAGVGANVHKNLEPGELARHIERAELNKAYGISKATKDEKKDVAAGAAAGAGGGALAAPGRRINPGGRKIDPKVKNLPEGTHDIDPRKLQRHAQGTGFRFGDKAHVARTAKDIGERGYDRSKPVGLTIWDDRAVVTDGNHRVHGTATAGAKSVPVQVRRAKGRSPADQPRAVQIYDYVRGQRQRKYYAGKRGNSEWIDRNAKKAVRPDSLRGKINTKLTNLGSMKAPRAAKTLSRGKYAAANAAFIGGGAALAGGGAAMKNTHDRKKAA